MALRGRVATIWTVILMALACSWATPAAAQDTPGEYRTSIDNIYLDIRALWGELDRFKVESRYCNPSPPPPSKAQAQAELAALEKRVSELNGRYNALKQSLLNFLDHNHRLYSEMMVNGRDPRERQWWSRDDNNRQRMLDELARKKAALAAAPEVDCRPKPKPQPPTAVTTGGFQPPALPVRPSASATGWPALPTHFCSWDERIKFFEQFDPVYLKASDDAVRAAEFRTAVEQAVNAYVQSDRPVPPDLIARRRQAITDVEQAARRVREAEDMRRRALAIPVIDCRQPVREEPPRTEPPRTEPPPTAVEPGPKFQSGSLLDDIRNRAWAQVEAMKAAYDRCDPAAYERALRELEKLVDEARLARGAARGAGEFSTVTPKEAEGLVEALLPIIETRRWLLLDLRRKCGSQPPTHPPPTPSQTGFVPPPDRRMAIILDEHNKTRAEVGVPRLQWDPQLAAGAAAYAAELARTGQRVHAPREGRGAVRENLNQGMLGWNADQMVRNWLKEKQNFVPGTYPNVTRTGRWQDVSHYTQMIWPTTTQVGCGLASGSGYQWLVCRYSPGGNKDGQPVGLPSNQPVIANDGGIAPPNSSTPMIPDLPRMKVGGGMTQIDPPAPPPPPLPTASDPAPAGDEAQHPLRSYFVEALFRFDDAWLKCDRAAMDRALAEMRYAIDELKKRLKAAKAAGRFSTVNPDEVQKSIELLERTLRRQMERPPRGDCPVPPPLR